MPIEIHGYSRSPAKLLLKCPHCGDIRSRVLHNGAVSAPIPGMGRKRECYACHARFTTVEITELELERKIK